MPEVVAVLIPWLIFLCPVLLSFSHPSVKKCRSRALPVFRALSGSLEAAQKMQRMDFPDFVPAIAHSFFLLKWKLSSNSDRGFPGVETTGNNFVFLLKDQHCGIALSLEVRLELWRQHWSLCFGISLFWYIHADGLSLNIWVLFESVVKCMIVSIYRGTSVGTDA